VPFPPGETFGPLFVRCTNINGFRFAGQAHDSTDPACWEYDPEEEDDGWWSYQPPCCGVSPVIYDRDGVLHRSDCGPGLGSQGYRYVTDANVIVSGDATYRIDLGSGRSLFEYTDVGGLLIGQAAYDGGGVQVWDGTVLRQLETGDCRFIRANRDGDTVALAFTRPEGVVLMQTTVAELRTLPPVVTPEPPVTDPRPIERVGPPKPAGTRYDLLPFVISDPSLQPRRGPSHTLGQIVRPQPRGALVYWVKFAGNEPGVANGESYEGWAYDANWIYQLEDASGWDADTSTDLRMWPTSMQVGEAFAFNTGPHEKVWHDRVTCRETKRDPWQRKMWLAEVADWYWGADLGVRETATLVYDATGGFHIPGRYIEIGFYARGAGSCRWEPHKSEIVYANGQTAVFSDASRADRKDFYLVGGPNPQPKLLACIPHVVPNYPPWPPTPPTPDPPKPTIPMEDDMRAYGPIVPGFKPGKDHDNGNGTISVQKPNGKWLCVTPDGGIEERDTPGGAWESFYKSGTSLVAERDGGARGTLVYVLAIAG
jgi:hypothetical protein